ncbi:hypothetical protein SAMD00019534_104670 [Acytostelium subglobosum LB1]|uniref:hypothetical protein n=1 Tax=Acytostelium subglobosum LB1 TaxID=1410327 RepID=UPI000644D53E|nr:hypothetical protein SAMD00019534_104670 [Acytostelium subglobosum LB1]GAM27292.1 hypothetical protein SAMD00019534_104670 [Acytostelium subglobosum LB1]|eukprot:XP_012749759.1 hypothetical protein SAMD00019534_104670 [Acytostelium subglobosum LB1]
MGGWDLPQSKWHNPYRRTNDAEDIVGKYEKYIMSNQSLLKDLPELFGKRLGCWCKDKSKNSTCHGDILAKLANELWSKTNSLTVATSNDEDDGEE